jgi:hypothetical protein
MDMPDGPDPVMINQLIQQTSPGEWIRGKAYYRNRRVRNLAVTAMLSGDWSVRAEVHAADTHTGRLTLTTLRDQLMDWHCTCPQDHHLPCRHVIAVLLQYLHDTSNSQSLRHLLAAQVLSPADSNEIMRTEVHILFRYQKQNDRILVMPRLIKRNAAGQKVMSTNPLDPDDRIVSSQVTDRLALMRDRTTEQAILDFFGQWKHQRLDLIGCLSFDAEQDLPLLVQQVLPTLPAAWRVLYDSEFEKIIPGRKTISVDFTQLRPGSADLLAFDLTFHCEQLQLDLKQLQDYLNRQQKWLLVNGQFIEAANRKQLGRFLDLLTYLQGTASSSGHYESEPAFLADLVLAGEDPAANPEQTGVRFDSTFASLRAGLTSEQLSQTVTLPKSIDLILRPYQRHGVQWLLFLGHYHLGGVLADEMGLGKTLQVLAALSAKRRTKPSLIICPKTLLFNWQNEARRFAPTLKTVLVHGSQDYRMRLLRQAYDFDLLITSYPLVQRDIAQFNQLEFDCCILDEAQIIKNPATHLTRHVKKIKASQRIALTGTPMENHILDLWSIFDFILPGYLGPKDAFRMLYDETNQDKLLLKIRPFLLRRTKQDVLPELPEKIEETIYASLTQNQLALYHQALTQIRKSMQETIDRQGLARSRMAILAGLTRLRQISNHPGLLHEAYRPVHGISGKLELFDEMLQNLLANGHKVLVFSQFTQMLAILIQRLQERRIAFCYLDGQTQDRQQVIHRFNTDPDLSVFLISLKAGGFGLNLTAADTVILFDPWWNPMVENQAADRTHRIGQHKVVTVYRLISQGTIEEQIEKLQEKKQMAFDRIINQSAGKGSHLITIEDLKALLDHDGPDM